MSKTKNGGIPDMVSEARALDFCAQLNPTERRLLSMCIDRRIVESGYPSGVRAGNPAWCRARIAEVSALLRRGAELRDMSENIAHVEDLLHDDEAIVRQMAKDTLNRIQSGADFLAGEARENRGQTYFEDDDLELDEAA